MADQPHTEDGGCTSCSRAHVKEELDLNTLDPSIREVYDFLCALPDCKVDIKVVDTVSPDPIQAFAAPSEEVPLVERKIYGLRIVCPTVPGRKLIAGMYAHQFNFTVAIPAWAKKVHTLVVPYQVKGTNQWSAYPAESLQPNMDPMTYEIVWQLPHVWIPTYFPIIREIVATPDVYTLTEEDRMLVAAYDAKRFEAVRNANDKHAQKMRELEVNQEYLAKWEEICKFEVKLE